MLLHTTPSHPSPPADGSGPELTRRQRLQLAVRDYGSTVMVFHITISLASLGAFYTAVSRSAECCVGLGTSLKPFQLLRACPSSHIALDEPNNYGDATCPDLMFKRKCRYRTEKKSWQYPGKWQYSDRPPGITVKKEQEDTSRNLTLSFLAAAST